MLLAALYVSVDRRITLKSLKAKLEPYVGTSVDNFKVVLRVVCLCSISFCLSVLLLFFFYDVTFVQWSMVVCCYFASTRPTMH